MLNKVLRLVRRKGIQVYALLAVLVVSAFSMGLVGAQTPVPLDSDDLVTSGTNLINAFGIMAVITAGAVIGIAVYLFRRFKTGAR